MVPRMTMRGLAYLKMSINDLIDKCPHTKQRILCCTGCFGWKPHTPHEPDLLKLVPMETDHASLHSLDLAVDEARPRPGLNSLKGQLPFTSGMSLPTNLKAKLMKKEDRRTIKRFTKQFLKRLVELEEELKGVGVELEEQEQPMMFIPGRILHLEEEQEYATRRSASVL